MVFWKFLVVLMALISMGNCGREKLCGRRLVESLRLACEGRGYNGHQVEDCGIVTEGPTRERRSATTISKGIVDECCYSSCSHQTLTSYCRQLCHQSDTNDNEYLVFLLYGSPADKGRSNGLFTPATRLVKRSNNYYDKMTPDDSAQMDSPDSTSAPAVATQHNNVIQIETDTPPNQDSPEELEVGTIQPIDVGQLIHLDD